MRSNDFSEQRRPADRRRGRNHPERDFGRDFGPGFGREFGFGPASAAPAVLVVADVADGAATSAPLPSCSSASSRSTATS